MSKAIAKFALMVISIGLMLGNYWFTFGLWPRSWWAFAFFASSITVVAILHTALDKADA